jgi:hypothetical protein
MSARKSATRRPEIIRSNEVIHKGDIGRIETRGEIIKIRASIAIGALSLLIACAVLGSGMYFGNTELQSWATGLISGVAGAAVTYGFNRIA